MDGINIAGILAPIVGNLRGTLEANAIQAANTLISSTKELIFAQKDFILKQLASDVDCDAVKKQADFILSELGKLKSERDRVVNFLQSANKSLDPIFKVIHTTKGVVDAFSTVVTILKAIPIPQAIAGVGLPISVTVLISDILAWVSAIIVALQEGITAIDTFTTPVQAMIQQLITYLLTLDQVFIFLDTIRTLLGTLCTVGAIPRHSPSDCITPFLNLAENATNSIVLDKSAATSNSENLVGMQISGNIVEVRSPDTGEWKPFRNYRATSAIRDLCTFSSTYYVNTVNHYSMDQGMYGSPAGVKTWETLGKVADIAPILQKIVDPVSKTVSLSTLLKEIIQVRNSSNNRDFAEDYQNSLNKLKQCPIPQEIKDRLLSDLSNISTPKTKTNTDNKNYYTGPDGTRYILEVIPENSYSKIAVRHYAVAKTLQGIVAFQGTPSFSSSTEVLLDEIKFKISTNTIYK